MSKFRMELDPRTTMAELTPLCTEQNLRIEIFEDKAYLVQPADSMLPPPTTEQVLKALGWLA